MRIPKFTAELSLNKHPLIAKNNRPYGSSWQLRMHAQGLKNITPAVDLGCVSRCVGPTAYDCMHCDDDIECWKGCAGNIPRTISCLRECF